jgi:Protein of unknown function (DUF3263)
MVRLVDLPSAHLRARDATLAAAIEADAAAIVAAVEAGSTDVDVERSTTETLAEHQRAILDFERQWWRQQGAKEQAIRDNFEMSPTRYYQTLNALIDLPPGLVNRLQRLRAAAARGRRLR